VPQNVRLDPRSRVAVIKPHRNQGRFSLQPRWYPVWHGPDGTREKIHGSLLRKLDADQNTVYHGIHDKSLKQLQSDLQLGLRVIDIKNGTCVPREAGEIHYLSFRFLGGEKDFIRWLRRQVHRGCDRPTPGRKGPGWRGPVVVACLRCERVITLCASRSSDSDEMDLPPRRKRNPCGLFFQNFSASRN